MQPSFGLWLKQRRKTLDLTREDLAQRIGCAVITIRKIETGERRPSKQIAELLAEHLNIPPDDRIAFTKFARTGVMDHPSEILWGTPFHPPTNLPIPPTPLIGRDTDVGAIRKRLHHPDVRLITLIGPPGIGKTRLALQVAGEALDDFADGVVFVALAPITDAHLVPTAIANALGVPEFGPIAPFERVKAFLREKQSLLVLDNFEQLLDAAPSIAQLLATCPLLKIIVTSRAPLRIRQERQISVSPLALPDLAHLSDIERISNCAGVMLFVERAQAVMPDFSLTPENSATVAMICTRLDGLPLAIELISARIRLLPPAALLERLGGQLMLHSDGLRDIEPRHRTLNAAIDWSYELLRAEEQILFRRLAVFARGWTFQSAETVCLSDLTINLLDSLASLLDKNLIAREIGSGNGLRFTMLETIREYALDRLITAGELEQLQVKHASYFLQLAEMLAPESIGGADQGNGWDELEREHANLRAALVWSQTAASGEIELRLTVALGDFWAHRGHSSEGIDWLNDALAHSEGVYAYRLLRAKALAELAIFCQWQGNLAAAQPRHEECIALFRALENYPALAEALGTYGMLFMLRGEFEHADALIQESLALANEMGNDGLIALSYLFMGDLAYSRGDIRQAGTYWQESLQRFRLQPRNWNISVVLDQLAMVALEEGHLQQALAYLAESLTRFEALGERWQAIHALEMFACVAVAQEGTCENTGRLLIRAARLFGAAEALREAYSTPPIPFQQRPYDLSIVALRAQFREEALNKVWTEGRTMTFEQAVRYALSE